MKKNYLIALLALICNFAFAQIEQVNYRGAFAPAPTTMWTDSWTNWNPQNEAYTDAATVVNVTTNITTNTTWSAGKTYKISGLIFVTNNATLTIEAGVVVKAIYTSTGTALVVTKGAKLNAVGTADAPIVFTSAKAAGQRASGDWGGIILLGKAGFNINGGVNNIEGITASVNTEYGGGTTPNHDDNSGTMKYCRIEFPGFVFSPNNEINGLTFGSVGRGTTIDYVQVSYSGDDSYEWFGGAVNCKHLVAYKGLDDDFDTDNGYKGIVQFALGVRDPAISDNPSISTSEGFESDNNPSGTVAPNTDNTSCIFTNCTLIGPAKRALLSPTVTIASGHARAARLRRASEQKIFNSIFLDFKQNFLFIDGTAALANAVSGALKFKNNILAGVLDSSITSGFSLNGSNATTIPSYLTSNTVVNSSDTILTKAYGTSSADYAAGNLATTATNLDYRPGATAATGADFSDSSLSQYINNTDKPTVTNLAYCKGDVALPLTATLTSTGILLKWYTAATGGTPSITAPTPLTTTAPATLNYWVSQINNTGFESARVQITVTVNALPTDVLTAITGTDPDGLSTTAAITTVSKFVGTDSLYTYSTSGIGTGTTYLWTVPNGVTITEGQGTATIKVKYANVSAGAGTIGTINVQAVNTNGCKTVAKTLTITKALPLAPATIYLYNKNTGYATPTTAITNYGKYMGQSTALTLTAAASAGSSAYKWELPAGVNLAIPNDVTPVTTTKTYTAEPFLSPNTPATTVAGKYWVVTKRDYTFPVNNVSTTISISSAKQNIIGSGSCKFTLTSGTVGSIINVGTVFTYNGDTYVLSTATAAADTSLTCAIVFPLAGSNYPTETTSSTTTTTIGTLTSGSTTFNFKRVEVTPARTYTFTVAANASNVCSVGTPLTYNGDTYIVATAVTSTATSIVCRPSASPQPAGNYPSLASTTVSGSLTKSDGSTISFTKIAKANYDVTTSQDYPSYGTVITSNLPSILVKFDGVTNSATTKLYIGVKAMNGVGSSVTSNATNTDVVANRNIPGLFYTTYTENYTSPNATTLTNGYSTFTASGTSPSTAKLLTLTATVPAAVTALAGEITNLVCGATKSYTITASAFATGYTITAPANSVVTAADAPNNATNSVYTTTNAFSVTYPSTFAITSATSTANKSLVIRASNGIGNSATDLTKTLTTAAFAGTISAHTSSTTTTALAKFKTCQVKNIAVPAFTGASSYVWTVADGAVITDTDQTTRTINVDFSAVTATSTVITVKAVNSCGISSTVKTITLTKENCTSATNKIIDENTISLVSNTEMYPNPASDVVNFNIDATSNGVVKMTIYSLDGKVVMESKGLNVENGTNSFTENVSNLNRGIYLVRITNSTSNEVITKKLIKN